MPIMAARPSEAEILESRRERIPILAKSILVAASKNNNDYALKIDSKDLFDYFFEDYKYSKEHYKNDMNSIIFALLYVDNIDRSFLKKLDSSMIEDFKKYIEEQIVIKKRIADRSKEEIKKSLKLEHVEAFSKKLEEATKNKDDELMRKLGYRYEYYKKAYVYNEYVSDPISFLKNFYYEEGMDKKFGLFDSKAKKAMDKKYAQMALEIKSFCYYRDHLEREVGVYNRYKEIYNAFNLELKIDKKVVDDSSKKEIVKENIRSSR